MKQVFVQLAGSECQPVEITIMPAVTVREILDDLNLAGWVLTTSEPTELLAEEEVMYDRVTAGDRLWVSYYGCGCGG